LGFPHGAFAGALKTGEQAGPCPPKGLQRSAGAAYRVRAAPAPPRAGIAKSMIVPSGTTPGLAGGQTVQVPTLSLDGAPGPCCTLSGRRRSSLRLSLHLSWAILRATCRPPRSSELNSLHVVAGFRAGDPPLLFGLRLWASVPH
jgi:hypothetical protein